MTVLTAVQMLLARQWHDLSDHARDGDPFGGGLCNCLTLAPRLERMVRRQKAIAWERGYHRGCLDSEMELEPAENPYYTGADELGRWGR